MLWRKRHKVRRSFACDWSGERIVIVIVCGRGGNPVPSVFHFESQASAVIGSPIDHGTVVHADEASLWGTTRMSVSKSNGSTTRKPVLWTVPARIGRRGTSAVSAVLKSASTITLRAQTSFDPRKKVHGGKITGV
jgi:hypothetical protein